MKKIFSIIIFECPSAVGFTEKLNRIKYLNVLRSGATFMMYKFENMTRPVETDLVHQFPKK